MCFFFTDGFLSQKLLCHTASTADTSGSTQRLKAMDTSSVDDVSDVTFSDGLSANEALFNYGPCFFSYFEQSDVWVLTILSYVALWHIETSKSN